MIKIPPVTYIKINMSGGIFVKKYSVKIFFSLILCIGYLFLLRGSGNIAAGFQKNPMLVIDAGHGGSDPGMVGIDQIEEKTINLEIAKKVKLLLEKNDFQVVMTREADIGLYDSEISNKKVQDMQKRIELLRMYQPELCISIHQNSYPDESVAGPQVFYYKDSEQGKLLAEILQSELNRILEIERPRMAKANSTYYLLKRSPCVLNIVECGFLTNRVEAELLKSSKYQEKVAEAIVEGICLYQKKILHSKES